MDNSIDWMIGIGAALLAVGLWMMAPRGVSRGRWTGAILTAAGLGFLVSQVPGLGQDGANFAFYVLAAATVLPAIATVTCASPMYAAIWFAMTLLGTAGLFLFQGSQFLGVATVVVYAGAILVTFLFVLMLAQPGGKASYDRVSWEAPFSAAAGAVMIGMLTLLVVTVFHPSKEAANESMLTPLPTEAELDANLLTSDHMARLGAELFSRHLISVEIAGTLLLVGLVGCVAIVSHMHKPRRGKEATLARSVSEVVSGGSLTHIGMSGIGTSGIGISGQGGGFPASGGGSESGGGRHV